MDVVGVIGEIWAEVAQVASSFNPDDQPGLTRKRLGEIAEAEFMTKAAKLGFGVAKPWGDSHPYDFIVQAGEKLWKVQVKSAYRSGQDGCYSFHAHPHALRCYRKDEIDFLVAYVAPEDAWYVIPVSAIEKVRSFKLFAGSRRKRSKFEKYREQWGRMRVAGR